nr:polysaccharide deacetylase family protein [Cytophagales bacterium]
MFFYRVPAVVQWMYPGRVWHLDRKSSKVYLTFDDGPVDGVTDFILDQLSERNMKGTFFMVGENIVRNPSLARRVLNEGHRIGNHTFNHLNGRRTTAKEYLRNVTRCTLALEDQLGISTDLFRPPYGRITPQQGRSLTPQYKVIMWEVLAGDFIAGIDEVRSLRKITESTQNGSILLFHDQLKTAGFIKRVLPSYLDFLVESGFQTGIV